MDLGKEMIVTEEAYAESESVATEQDSEHIPGAPTIEDLQRRCNFLLFELRAFAEHLRKLGRENLVELRGPSGAIEAELKALKKLSEAADGEGVQARSKHILRSSNIPYHEAVWATAKRSSGVIAFNKRFFWQPPKRAHNKEDLKLKYRYSALVDIVAQDGAEWIKVSTVTETRLLFELARQGWAGSSSDEDDSTISNHKVLEEDEDDRVSILRMAEDLAKAAKATRVRYRHPNVRFIVPKVKQGRLREIDKLLADVRATGVNLETEADTTDLDVTTPALSAALGTLTVDEFADFTPTLNVDCTILLALVSDLSHAHIETKPWFHRATTRQIEMEEKETLLPTSLYPAMGARTLVCTREAAQRMREIVDTIGTVTEKARTALLLGDSDNSADDDAPRHASQSDLVANFHELSDYEVPAEWQLPVHVVDKDDCSSDGGVDLPRRLADKVEEKLSDINKSVFLYGWRSGLTTITSNRMVARVIEETIEANRDEKEEDAVGPPLWLCPMARSLVGKEKNRQRS